MLWPAQGDGFGRRERCARAVGVQEAVAQGVQGAVALPVRAALLLGRTPRGGGRQALRQALREQVGLTYLL